MQPVTVVNTNGKFIGKFREYILRVIITRKKVSILVYLYEVMDVN